MPDWLAPTAKLTFQKGDLPRFHVGMGVGTGQHAIIDVINTKISDVFTYLRAAVSDDIDPLKRNTFMLVSRRKRNWTMIQFDSHMP